MDLLDTKFSLSHDLYQLFRSLFVKSRSYNFLFCIRLAAFLLTFLTVSIILLVLYVWFCIANFLHFLPIPLSSYKFAFFFFNLSCYWIKPFFLLFLFLFIYLFCSYGPTLMSFTFVNPFQFKFEYCVFCNPGIRFLTFFAACRILFRNPLFFDGWLKSKLVKCFFWIFLFFIFCW